jgi:hypothetical protein
MTGGAAAAGLREERVSVRPAWCITEMDNPTLVLAFYGARD